MKQNPCEISKHSKILVLQFEANKRAQVKTSRKHCTKPYTCHDRVDRLNGLYNCALVRTWQLFRPDERNCSMSVLNAAARQPLHWSFLARHGQGGRCLNEHLRSSEERQTSRNRRLEKVAFSNRWCNMHGRLSNTKHRAHWPTLKRHRESSGQSGFGDLSLFTS